MFLKNIIHLVVFFLSSQLFYIKMLHIIDAEREDTSLEVVKIQHI